MRTGMLNIAVASAVAVSALAGCTSTSPAEEVVSLCEDSPTTLHGHDIEYIGWIIYEPAIAEPGEPPLTDTASGEYEQFVVDGEPVELRTGDVLGLDSVAIEIGEAGSDCVAVTIVKEN